jgi:hypothetical protein
MPLLTSADASFIKTSCFSAVDLELVATAHDTTSKTTQTTLIRIRVYFFKAITPPSLLTIRYS